MDFFLHVHTKKDGRQFLQYSTQPFSADYSFSGDGLLRPLDWNPPTLRHHATRDEWVAISTSRNTRPFLPPKEYCPLCPANDPQFPSEIPMGGRTYQWAVFENMFPALALQEKGTGHCEVVLYSPDHNSTLSGLPLSQIEGLFYVWQHRSQSLGKNHAQVFLFENKGAEVGVTLHHPHGQIYAFQSVPPFLKKEQETAQAHWAQHGTCLICAETEKELSEKERIVFETENLVAFVPYAARYPYEVHITTKQHRTLIEHLTPSECTEAAQVLLKVLEGYDGLFGFPMPYILAHHQVSHKTPNDPSYHWHIELYPPYRSKDKLKYLAGVESGTGFFVNDTSPEEKAAEMRKIIKDLALKSKD
jgi:UDPglucose--hexose-1-phosphate uridylyltransferase